MTVWDKVLTGADDVPLGQPVLRYSDLNENSTRYDYLAAAPDDKDLIQIWIAVGTTSAVVALWVGIVLSSVLSSRKVRSLSFNLYLVFLMIPDFLMSFLCTIACFLAVSAGQWYSSFMCKFQSWFIVFGIAGNSWMTVIILRQIHKMLCNAQKCIRYKNPTRKEVCIQSGLVLLWASFLGIWAVLPYDWNVPIRTFPQQGYACVPIEYNFPSSLFYFLVFFPLLSGIPLIYTTYVIFNIWRKSLLPKKGQRRIFAVYMVRIIVTMYFWWLPSIMFKYFIPSLIGPWGKAFFSIWMHLQGIVSAGMMIGKPDIKKAVRGFLTCRADPCVALCGRPPIPDDIPSSRRPKRAGSVANSRLSINLGWGSRFGSSLRSLRMSSVKKQSSAECAVKWSNASGNIATSAHTAGTSSNSTSNAPVSNASNVDPPKNDEEFVENEETAKLQVEQVGDDGDDDDDDGEEEEVDYGYGSTIVEEADDGAGDADEEVGAVEKEMPSTIPEE